MQKSLVNPSSRSAYNLDGDDSESVSYFRKIHYLLVCSSDFAQETDIFCQGFGHL